MKNNRHEQKDYKIISISVDTNLYSELKQALKRDKTIMPRHTISSYINYLIWSGLKSKCINSECPIVKIIESPEVTQDSL